eukprot:3779858-Amphidinium_carterae.1
MNGLLGGMYSFGPGPFFQGEPAKPLQYPALAPFRRRRRVPRACREEVPQASTVPTITIT